jgi:Xaa-Pro aminopeptidase
MMEHGSNDWWPQFSVREYRRRYEALREAMSERGLDCLVVFGAPLYFGTDAGAPNLVYLSAYAPAPCGYVVFPRDGDPTLVIYVSAHLANARRISVIADVRGGTNMPAAMCERVRELGFERGRIGIVGNFAWANWSVPLEHFQALSAGLPRAKFEIVTDWYEEHRLAKSEEELEFMAAGAAICDRAFASFRRMAAPGATNVALHNEVLRAVHAQGGRIAFGHVGSCPMREPAMVYPDFYATNRVLQRGDVVMTELTGGYGGYFGKLYTTSFIGAPTAEYRDMFELAAASYRQLIGAIRPGASGKDIAPALTAAATKAGYKSRSFISGWSTYNSQPVSFAHHVQASEAAMQLRPGQCLNVGGWIVSGDERMGVWVGDTVAVTEDGVRRLHRAPIDQLPDNILDE